MENEFAQVMSERTDEELVRIVTVERESYQSIAIEAAETEVEKRNLDISKFDQLVERATIEKEQTQKVESNIVGSGIRFANFLIDLVIWVILATILSSLLYAVNDTQWFISVIIIGSYIGYYALMEIKFQKTIGKFVTKTKVVKVNGEKPTSSDIFSRTLCRLIPFDKVSFLFMKNGFHDILSKTKVVKDKMD